MIGKVHRRFCFLEGAGDFLGRDGGMRFGISRDMARDVLGLRKRRVSDRRTARPGEARRRRRGLELHRLDAVPIGLAIAELLEGHALCHRIEEFWRLILGHCSGPCP